MAALALLLSLMGMTRIPENSPIDYDQQQYKVVCYLRSWAIDAGGEGDQFINSFDPSLCTHAVYVSAKLEGNQIISSNPYWDLKREPSYVKFKSLKKKNPDLKTLISIGGWYEGSAKYSQMAADPNARTTFVQSAVDFCLKYKFDGLDFNWEHTAHIGGASYDKKKLVHLLKELKEAFAPHGLLLSAAVSADKNIIDTAYDIPGASKHLDFINVKSFDFHGPWENKTGHTAPLYAGSEGSESEKTRSVDFAIKYWLKNGAPRNKIILGMNLYGSSFTLVNPKNHGLGAPATGPGRAGLITRQPGILEYNEICRDKGWKEEYDAQKEAPYAYKGKQWVSYENEESIAVKAEYVIANRLGGGMIWSTENDDFQGNCGGDKYPMLKTVASKLNGEKMTHTPRAETTRQPDVVETTTQTDVVETTTQTDMTEMTTQTDMTEMTTQTDVTETTTTPVVPTTKPPKKEFKCTEEGYFRDPVDCNIYYYCQRRGRSFHKFSFNCPEGTVFDERVSVCNWPYNVPGCE